MSELFHITIGLTTMMVSLAGMIITAYHYLFFSRSDEGLAPTVARVFLSDSIIYLITLLFGVWALFDLGFKVAMNLQIIRIPILLFNIYATYRLFQSIKSLRGKV